MDKTNNEVDPNIAVFVFLVVSDTKTPVLIGTNILDEIEKKD